MEMLALLEAQGEMSWTYYFLFFTLGFFYLFIGCCLRWIIDLLRYGVLI